MDFGIFLIIILSIASNYKMKNILILVIIILLSIQYSCKEISVNPVNYFNNEVVIYSKSCDFNKLTFTLKGDYGFRIETKQFLLMERNKLFLYQREEQIVVSTFSVKAFAKELKKLPTNSTIAYYKTYASSNKEFKEWNLIQEVIEKRNFTLLGYPEVPYTLMCTCGICP